MNGMKSLFVCVLIVLLGNICHAGTCSMLRKAARRQSRRPKPSNLRRQSRPCRRPRIATKPKPPRPSSASALTATTRPQPKGSSRPSRDHFTPPVSITPTSHFKTSCHNFRDEYGIPIQLDKTALEEAGIGTDTQGYGDPSQYLATLGAETDAPNSPINVDHPGRGLDDYDQGGCGKGT